LFTVTKTGPDVSFGAMNVSMEDEASVMVAGVPLIVILFFESVALNLAPDIFTSVPTVPLSGVIVYTTGKVEGVLTHDNLSSQPAKRKRTMNRNFLSIRAIIFKF
jgi:hypothetical protein